MSNHDFAKIMDTSDEWIRERTGIQTRHIAAPEEATSDLAFHAATRAIAAAGMDKNDIDAILIGTTTPDQVMPNTACVLQTRLGCRSVMALDMYAACSGFLYATSIADQFVRTGMYRNILVVGAETLSRIVNWEDRSTCILFGDGAGAAIVSRAAPGERSQILSSHLHANGELGPLLTVPGGGSRLPFSQKVLDEKLHYVHMKGREIFKSAVRSLSDRCNEALQANGLTGKDVDWLIAHQANLRIIQAVADSFGIAQERVLVNVEKTGNTSSASIPILLDESVRSGKIKRGDMVLTTAFGGGLTSASVLFRY